MNDNPPDEVIDLETHKVNLEVEQARNDILTCLREHQKSSAAGILALMVAAVDVNYYHRSSREALIEIVNRRYNQLEREMGELRCQCEPGTHYKLYDKPLYNA